MTWSTIPGASSCHSFARKRLQAIELADVVDMGRVSYFECVELNIGIAVRKTLDEGQVGILGSATVSLAPQLESNDPPILSRLVDLLPSIHHRPPILRGEVLIRALDYIPTSVPIRVIS